MLGVTGLLVGTVFLTSIFVQTVMGYSALRTGVAFVPFALAITVGTAVARHCWLTPRRAPSPPPAWSSWPVARSCCPRASAGAQLRHGPAARPALLGLGVGMVFAPVSVTAMAGIPPQHAGMAAGFLMTGHEVGAALGVAVLSAVASTAGSLTSATGVVAGSRAASSAAAVIAAVLAVFAVPADATDNVSPRAPAACTATTEPFPANRNCEATAMRAIVQDRYGSADVLELRDVAQPAIGEQTTFSCASSRRASTAEPGTS